MKLLLISAGSTNRSVRGALVTAGIAMPAYAIDPQRAIRVVDGRADVISEGHWQRFEPRVP